MNVFHLKTAQAHQAPTPVLPSKESRRRGRGRGRGRSRGGARIDPLGAPNAYQSYNPPDTANQLLPVTPRCLPGFHQTCPLLRGAPD